MVFNWVNAQLAWMDILGSHTSHNVFFYRCQAVMMLCLCLTGLSIQETDSQQNAINLPETSYSVPLGKVNCEVNVIVLDKATTDSPQ